LGGESQGRVGWHQGGHGAACGVRGGGATERGGARHTPRANHQKDLRGHPTDAACGTVGPTGGGAARSGGPSFAGGKRGGARGGNWPNLPFQVGRGRELLFRGGGPAGMDWVGDRNLGGPPRWGGGGGPRGCPHGAAGFAGWGGPGVTGPHFALAGLRGNFRRTRGVAGGGGATLARPHRGLLFAKPPTAGGAGAACHEPDPGPAGPGRARGQPPVGHRGFSTAEVIRPT